VRHVAGTAFEQQSQRYVKYDDIKFVTPPTITGDTESRGSPAHIYEDALYGSNDGVEYGEWTIGII